MDSAERRQLSILFCDLVGSTALSAGLDPEDFRNVMGKYHACVAEVMSEHKGNIAQLMGDGALAYFGYPHADEDNTAQAIRAGLAVVHAVENLPTDVPTKLQVRVGIATGVVVVGELSASRELAVGETPNLAARLQSLAEPGTVLIDAHSHLLGGGHFDYRDLGFQDLKGWSEQVRVWQVLGTRDVKSRFEAMHGGNLSPLLGREEELDLLLRRWQSAVRGEGRVVLLTGEPGIGKSHIAFALEERLQADAHIALRFVCSAERANSSLSPIINQFELAAGFERNDSPSAKLSKLEGLVERSTDDAEHLRILANLLGLSFHDGIVPTELSPQQRKEKIFAMLLAMLERWAARRPVFVIFEDVHWIDPTSLELLTATAEHVGRLRILLVVTARSEFSCPWSNHSHSTTILLRRLEARHGAELVERVTGGKKIPKELLDEILGRTDGVPLFIEELTKTVLEAGVLHEHPERYELTYGHLQMIPKTLHGSLLARLDRLGPSRDVAQIGAVIGREFWYELLRVVSEKPEAALRMALDGLVASELVYRSNTHMLVTFVFKHALIRDAAESMLLRARRRELHGRIAKALEDHFPEVVSAQPELIAYHCQGADNPAKAVEYLSLAAERALSRSALKEAYAHISQALKLLAKLPEAESRKRDELKLQVALARTLLEQKGYADPEVEAAYMQLRDFSQELSSSETYLAALYGLWAHHYVAARCAMMLEQANQFVAVAEDRGEAGPIMVGYRMLGTTRLILGSVAEANVALDEALLRYLSGGHGTDAVATQSLRARFGQDVGVTLYSYRSWALWLSGEAAEAETASQAALQRSETLNHDHQSRLYALWHAGITHVLMRKADRVAELGARLTEFANERELPYWQALGCFLRAWHMIRSDRSQVAVELVQEGFRLWTQTGSRVFRPICLAFLAEAYAASGDFDFAAQTFEEALQTAVETGERWAESEILRLFGDLQASYATAESAIEKYQQAIAVAQAQGAKSFELRAATSLARLLLRQGRHSDAHGLLSGIYAQFDPAYQTADLTDAKTLLQSAAMGGVLA